MIKYIKDLFQGKLSFGQKRSSSWPKIRRNHILKEKTCRACGGKKKLEVHHIKKFSTNPELELSPSNLMTLCEKKSNGVNCHLFFGHLGNYKSINPNVRKDVKVWSKKIKRRK